MAEQLPNDVMLEMEDKGIAIDDRISRDDFDRLSPIAKAAVVKAGIVLYDTATQRQFNNATSVERAEFLRAGGRIMGSAADRPASKPPAADAGTGADFDVAEWLRRAHARESRRSSD